MASRVRVLAKLMKTVVTYGNAFGADKLVKLGGNPHTVLMFGPGPLKPVIDIFNKCADAGLKAYAHTRSIRDPNDFYNVEMEPELQLEFGEAYPYAGCPGKGASAARGQGHMNYWSCTCYWPEVGNAPALAPIWRGPNLRR